MSVVYTDNEFNGVLHRRRSSALVNVGGNLHVAKDSLRNPTSIAIRDHVKLLTGISTSAAKRHDGQTMRSKMSAPLPYSRSKLTRTKSFNRERLNKRKSLLNQRRRLADAAFIFAFIGISIMVFESEMSAAHVYEKCSRFSNAAKGLISGSTFVLLLLIVWYYTVDAKMYMIDNFTNDWLAIATPGRIFGLLLELSICIVHPFPGCYPFAWGDRLTSPSAGVVTVDVPLSILMFLRFYLVGRLIMLHSTLFNSTSSRSIGALNQVNFSMSFAFRSLMQLHPGTMLVIFTLSYWIIASWSIRACDRFEDVDHSIWWNAMWTIAITFTTVGYGDMVALTYCGRAVSIVTGVVGVATTAFLITVLTQQLSLSMAEKNVHNFVIANHLAKHMKIAAANIIRESWFCYKYSKISVHKSRARVHCRQLMRAIHEMREVKAEQRKLYDDAENLAMAEEETRAAIEDDISPRLHVIEKELTGLQERMDHFNNLLENFGGSMHSLVVSIQNSSQLSLPSANGLALLPHYYNGLREDTANRGETALPESTIDPTLSTRGRTLQNVYREYRKTMPTEESITYLPNSPRSPTSATEESKI